MEEISLASRMLKSTIRLEYSVSLGSNDQSFITILASLFQSFTLSVRLQACSIFNDFCIGTYRTHIPNSSTHTTVQSTEFGVVSAIEGTPAGIPRMLCAAFW